MVFIVDQQNKARKLISAQCKFSSLQNNTLHSYYLHVITIFGIFFFLPLVNVPKEEEEKNREGEKQNEQNLSRNVYSKAFVIENNLKSMVVREPRTFIDFHGRQLNEDVVLEFYYYLYFIRAICTTRTQILPKSSNGHRVVNIHSILLTFVLSTPLRY